jgi:hypothetical protein
MTEFELELARFCKDLQAMLAKPLPGWFDPSSGLCENIYQWAGGGHNHHEGQSLQTALFDHFVSEFGNATFPFESGEDREMRWWNYTEDASANLLYLNPRRLAFIAHWAALAP